MRLFLFAIGARDRASSRLRVWDHLDWLSGEGHNVHADSLSPPGTTKADLGFLVRLVWRYPQWLYHFLRSDGVLVQESLVLGPAVLLKNLGKRRRVVFDFSDPVDRHGHGVKKRIRARLFRLMVRRADVVVVENKRYLEQLRGCAAGAAHFYGPVDAARYGAGRVRRAARDESGALRIGWTGSPGTFGLIAPLLPAIDALARERPIELFLIGAGATDLALRHAKLVLADWQEDREFDLVPTFDLGLFRLDGSEDSRWRGAGKLFIYMAAGVPFVASDDGIAGTLMRDTGIGFPVADDGAWLAALRAAAAAADVRADFAERSLRFARDKLSYEMYRAELQRHLIPPTQGR